MKFSFRSHCTKCNDSKLPISTSVQEFSCQSYRVLCKINFWIYLSQNTHLVLHFSYVFLKLHALFPSTVTKLLEPTLRNVERLALYPTTTKWSALMSTAKVETKNPPVTLMQNCPASVHQMVLAPMYPGETIPMWFVVGFKYIVDSKSGSFYST